MIKEICGEHYLVSSDIHAEVLRESVSYVSEPHDSRFGKLVGKSVGAHNVKENECRANISRGRDDGSQAGGTGCALRRLGSQPWEDTPGSRAANGAAAAGASPGRAKPLGRSPTGAGARGSCWTRPAGSTGGMLQPRGRPGGPSHQGVLGK